MIRIVHVTSGLGVGGAETMLYRLLSVIANNENQEHLVITLTPGCKFDFDRIGVKVKVIDLKKLGVLGLFTLRRVVHCTAGYCSRLDVPWQHCGYSLRTLRRTGCMGYSSLVA